MTTFLHKSCLPINPQRSFKHHIQVSWYLFPSGFVVDTFLSHYPCTPIISHWNPTSQWKSPKERCPLIDDVIPKASKVTLVGEFNGFWGTLRNTRISRFPVDWLQQSTVLFHIDDGIVFCLKNPVLHHQLFGTSSWPTLTCFGVVLLCCAKDTLVIC